MRLIIKTLLLLAFTSQFLWATEEIAIVKNLQGTVVVKRDKVEIPIKKGDSLHSGDIIKTAQQSSIGLIFSDGSTLSLGPVSMLVVNKYLFKPSSNQYDFDIFIKKGTAVYESGKIGKLAPEKVKFNLPQGSIGIRGTKFLVEVKE